MGDLLAGCAPGLILLDGEEELSALPILVEEATNVAAGAGMIISD